MCIVSIFFISIVLRLIGISFSFLTKSELKFIPFFPFLLLINNFLFSFFIYIYIYIDIIKSHCQKGFLWLSLSLSLCPNYSSFLAGPPNYIPCPYRADVSSFWLANTGMSICGKTSLLICVCLFVWVLWHINLCWLFNAKSIFIQINSFISSYSV